ncbi:hypothetical protein HPB47_016388 [Ixodes persulcatus]|uniref:Uncharacterized protein n=1 Tax=Ixodes persulcatus TaxID=34615 RepID=A0AC60QSA3_IXOPE|nr:hypothetical protein HPB47_016388 [Ixodes persulcatus]
MCGTHYAMWYTAVLCTTAPDSLGVRTEHRRRHVAPEGGRVFPPSLCLGRLRMPYVRLEALAAPQVPPEAAHDHQDSPQEEGAVNLSTVSLLALPCIREGATTLSAAVVSARAFCRFPRAVSNGANCIFNCVIGADEDSNKMREILYNDN